MTLSGGTRMVNGLDSDVALAAGGDASAFERLYRTHVGRIHSLTRRMLGSHEADEVTQDIFVRTWQKLGQFRGDSAFSTWLHRLAVNVVIERRRSFAIQRERITDDPAALDAITVAPARARPHGRFRGGDRTAAAGGARDFRAPRRRGLQASRDRGDARDRERNVETAAAPRADAVAPAPEWVMTMHDKWTDQLSDYLDGELTPDERAAVEAHLRGMRGVHRGAQRSEARRRAGAGDRAAPSASRLVATVSPRALKPAGRRGMTAVSRAGAARRFAFTMPQLAAASLPIAAMSGGLAWSVALRSANALPSTRGRPTPRTRAAPRAPAWSPTHLAIRPSKRSSLADAQYDAAVLDLERALKQGRGRLDPATIATVEHNLETIDQAIQQAREALAGDPANTYLSSHLVEARRRKLDLLRRATALTTSESD